MFLAGNYWKYNDKHLAILEIFTGPGPLLLSWWYIFFELRIQYDKFEEIKAGKSDPIDDQWWFGYSDSELCEFGRTFLVRMQTSEFRLAFIM